MSDDSDTSLFQLDGYNLILQGKRCSTRGGLIIYLKDTIKYKLIDIEANSNILEGQFIEIEQENVGNKKIILGNVYTPPRDTNENYNQFINEFVPILSDFGKSKSDVIIAGDYNIDLLKVLEKPVFSEYFDAVTALNFSRRLHFQLDSLKMVVLSLTTFCVNVHIASLKVLQEYC